jgi:hypothetical protein
MWYKNDGGAAARLSIARGSPLAFVVYGGWVGLTGASIFIDESGIQEGTSRYYLVTLVVHELVEDLSPHFDAYAAGLRSRGLPDIPFHSTPLMRGGGDYEDMDAETRNRLLVSFAAFVRRLPIRYVTFSYKSSEFQTRARLMALIRRDLVNFLVGNLEYFQSFDQVQIFYDDGQEAVRDAVREAFGYALSKEAAVFRQSDYRSYRLAQVADYLCALELAEIKYSSHEETPTDLRFFGNARAFRKNYLKQARRKAMA